MVMCPDLLQTELFAKIVLGFSLFSRHVVSVETRPTGDSAWYRLNPLTEEQPRFRANKFLQEPSHTFLLLLKYHVSAHFSRAAGKIQQPPPEGWLC